MCKACCKRLDGHIVCAQHTTSVQYFVDFYSATHVFPLAFIHLLLEVAPTKMAAPFTYILEACAVCRLQYTVYPWAQVPPNSV